MVLGLHQPKAAACKPSRKCSGRSIGAAHHRCGTHFFGIYAMGESESCESSMGHADLKDKRPNFVSYANSFILNILRDRHEHP